MSESDAASVPPGLAARLHRAARAERWRVTVTEFQAVLARCAARGQPGAAPGGAALERILDGLHLEDLALACACASGDEAAWEYFVREMRPALYRAADALDPDGGARDLADALYADLFGLTSRDGVRSSLFRYYHGRSSLATWLRALVAQRHVDRWRRRRREASLPEAESLPAPTSDRPGVSAETPCLAAIRKALGRAIASLTARDRLRLACYYERELTLAETGRLLGEHEATSSRHLARTRTVIRATLERALADDLGWSTERIAECFEEAASDSGPLDLSEWLGDSDRKNPAPDRSTVVEKAR
jgi:RNA polymerase sigma-70 factor, ECF subfamily